LILTQENAHKYVGKLLDAKHGLFHYYPLRVVNGKSGYDMIDRHDTRMRIPDEKHGGIFLKKTHS
jgi:hypothetical protein